MQQITNPDAAKNKLNSNLLKLGNRIQARAGLTEDILYHNIRNIQEVMNPAITKSGNQDFTLQLAKETTFTPPKKRIGKKPLRSFAYKFPPGKPDKQAQTLEEPPKADGKLTSGTLSLASARSRVPSGPLVLHILRAGRPVRKAFSIDLQARQTIFELALNHTAPEHQE